MVLHEDTEKITYTAPIVNKKLTAPMPICELHL